MAAVDRYSLASGATRWRVRYWTPGGTQTTRRGFATRREALAFARSVETDKSTGRYVPAAGGRVLVADLGPGLLARKRGVIKPSSMHSVESAWSVHVEPRWGSTPVGRVTHADVSAWVSELSGRRGPTIVRTAYSLLDQICRDAVRARLIHDNPCADVRLPARNRRPPVALTATQLHALANEAGRYRSLVLLAGTTALRAGEALALTPADIDWVRQRITVSRSATRVGGQTHVGSPKSADSVRSVPVPAFVLEALRETIGDRTGLIWPARDGGYLGPPSSHDSWWSGALARARAADPSMPRVTYHQLRSTAITLMLSAGVGLTTVARCAGHSDPSVTAAIYAGVLDADVTSAGITMDERYRPSRVVTAWPQVGPNGEVAPLYEG